MQRKGTILTIAALSVLTLAGCGSQASGQTGSGKYAAKQELNWTEPSELASSDLAQATDTLSFTVLQNTQEGLYRLNSKGTPANALATSTKITNGGKPYTFKLRKDAKWSNGQPVTAKDFVYSWQRTLAPKTASQDAFYLYQVENAEAVNQGKKPLNALGIKAHGDYKLTVQLTKPVLYFKKLLAWPLFYPLNQKAVDQYGKKYGTSSATTVYNGPFRLSKWNGTGKSWTLAKNATYWDKKSVRLDKINVAVTESTTTSYNLFNARKTDETLLSGQQIKNNSNSQDFVKRLPTGSQRLDLNEKKGAALKNADVRKALSLAIDRHQLVNDVLQDGSVAAKGYVPAGMGNNPKTGEAFNQEATTATGTSYDLKQAKALLAKGLGKKPLDLTLSVSDTDTSKQTAEFVQSSLEKLPNVKVTIKTVPYVQLINQQNNGNYELTLANWQSVFADPINFLDVFESNSSYNTGGWKNSQYDKLLDEAENQDGNQPSKRWTKLVQAEKILMNDQGTIPLFQTAKSQLLRHNVKGIIYNPAGVPYDFKTTYIAK